MGADFLPTASLETLKRRAELLAVVRRFFIERGYWEVGTPLLSRDVVVDAHIDPFCTVDDTGGVWYLQTSPEFAMKRLLVAGAEAIFQITKAFRRGEVGRMHNPEFTMLEWYRVGDTHHEQMDFTEELVRAVFQWGATTEKTGLDWFGPFERLSYDAAFERHVGTKVLHLTAVELRDLTLSFGIRPPESLPVDDRDAWLNLLLVARVETQLGIAQPTFLYDYPDTQSALARIREDTPPVAERFELYINGVELCNGYHELTDADELRRRIAAQAAIRQRDGLPALPADSRLLAAMDAGLPPCSGVALGIDRLALQVLGLDFLADIIPFPADRA